MAKRRHKPSGIILDWIGRDEKPHTKSIPDRETYLGDKQVELDAGTEFALLQLDCMGNEYGIHKASK